MNASISAWWHLSRESFLILRRDKIFVPVVVAGLAIAYFANLASGWGLEDFKKILFDIGLAGFRVTGAVVSILWGVRMVSDPLQDRSIELRIAAPSARFIWVLSRFTGLMICLLLMGTVFAGVWQLLMSLNNFGTMSNAESWALGLLVLEWLVLGSFGILMGTLVGFSTALFVTFSAWIAGLMAPLVAATMDQTIDPTQKVFVEFIANVWNFQRFNIIDQLEAGARTVTLQDLIPRLTWAGCVLLGCLVMASWVFQEKDLT
jgi:ABC-type transport system involved in multi-copper enzyme maturation permease subunit